MYRNQNQNWLDKGRHVFYLVSFLYFISRKDIHLFQVTPPMYQSLALSHTCLLSVFLHARLSSACSMAWLLWSLKYWFLSSEMNGKENSRRHFLVKQAIHIKTFKLTSSQLENSLCSETSQLIDVDNVFLFSLLICLSCPTVICYL